MTYRFTEAPDPIVYTKEKYREFKDEHKDWKFYEIPAEEVL
jgi:hypothetical protein